MRHSKRSLNIAPGISENNFSAKPYKVAGNLTKLQKT
jgi:hypothetical protein